MLPDSLSFEGNGKHNCSTGLVQHEMVIVVISNRSHIWSSAFSHGIDISEMEASFSLDMATRAVLSSHYADVVLLLPWVGSLAPLSFFQHYLTQ